MSKCFATTKTTWSGNPAGQVTAAVTVTSAVSHSRPADLDTVSVTTAPHALGISLLPCSGTDAEEAASIGPPATGSNASPSINPARNTANNAFTGFLLGSVRRRVACGAAERTRR